VFSDPEPPSKVKRIKSVEGDGMSDEVEAEQRKIKHNGKHTETQVYETLKLNACIDMNEEAL
jgi:hypothetical protein